MLLVISSNSFKFIVELSMGPAIHDPTATIIMIVIEDMTQFAIEQFK